ncbi:hypothetical protein [Clostridium perfringens]|uniref:hypothetical protein n=1 Tax=Clostridium perfringens TaxID=1502 RepID=UPI00232D151B|nr:hypothetical protein [Clostridium perfringens]MDB2050380.1 hypothetical protein [Clostridium perfringens]
MKEYNVYYRARGNKNAGEYNCTVTVNNKKEARENFNMWDNQNKEYTVVRIELV